MRCNGFKLLISGILSSMNFSPYNYKSLTEFVKQIRSISTSDDAHFNVALRNLIDIRSRDEEFKVQITGFAFLVLENGFFVNAFADYGIQSSLSLIHI